MENNTPAITGKEKNQDTSPEKKPATTGKTTEGEQVTLSKKEVDDLQAKVKNFQDLQGQADQRAKAEERKRKELERELLKARKSGEVPAPREPEDYEKLEVEKNIAQLLLQSDDYQKVLAADKTLKEILLNNPMAYVKDYFSVEDAMAQIKDKLDSRASELASSSLEKKEEKPEEKEKEEEIVAVPNPISEPGKGIPKVEKGKDKIAESIKGKIKFTPTP